MTESHTLAKRYQQVRAATERLSAPLAPEDQTPQSMADASPVKWHRAHTTWFFETFVLDRAQPGYMPFDPAYRMLFNSYYNTVGAQHARPERGLLTRPGVDEISRYRAQVDEQMSFLLTDGALGDELRAVVELGLHHEQQHQELIVTDLKHLLSQNPLHPAYCPHKPETLAPVVEAPLRWARVEPGLRRIGHAGAGFAFDNEGPAHNCYVHGFALATRPVTNGEYLEFIQDGGYQRADLWLADGWLAVNEGGWQAPLYWLAQDGGERRQFTLSGVRAVEPLEPVTHLSAYEADAYARWAGARLPTEMEWEVVATARPPEGHFAETARLHPAPAPVVTEAGDEAPGSTPPVLQLFGDVWEWTSSAYAAYPGYRAPAGALGEYNGKFMANQLVLRGGSCATPAGHIRATYRNFFYPSARWQFTGLRLARDLR